jgi:hypothetical protein
VFEFFEGVDEIGSGIAGAIVYMGVTGDKEQ